MSFQSVSDRSALKVEKPENLFSAAPRPFVSLSLRLFVPSSLRSGEFATDSVVRCRCYYRHWHVRQGKAAEKTVNCGVFEGKPLISRIFYAKKVLLFRINTLTLLRKFNAIRNMNKTDEELKYCYKYPHPSVTTDCVIFGFDGTKLRVLLVQRGILEHFIKDDESHIVCLACELLQNYDK